MINTIINTIKKLLDSDFDKLNLSIYKDVGYWTNISFYINEKEYRIYINSDAISITINHADCLKIKYNNNAEKYEFLKLVEQLKDQYRDYIASKFKMFVSGQYDNNEDNEIDQ